MNTRARHLAMALVVASWVVPFLVGLTIGLLARESNTTTNVLLPPYYPNERAILDAAVLATGVVLSLLAAAFVEAAKAVVVRSGGSFRLFVALLVFQVLVAGDYVATLARQWLVCFPAWLLGWDVPQSVLQTRAGFIPWISAVGVVVTLFLLSRWGSIDAAA